MNNFQELANFVWSIADEVLRDDFKRGKYPDGLFVAEGNPNTIDHLTAEKLKKHRFPFPDGPEQAEVVAALDHGTARIDAATAKTREQIAKFQEYRTALISAAVTGKIDVRGPGGESGIDGS